MIELFLLIATYIWIGAVIFAASCTYGELQKEHFVFVKILFWPVYLIYKLLK